MTVSRELYEELRSIKDDYKSAAHDANALIKESNALCRKLVGEVAELRLMLFEARDFIMSGPARGDEVAIVNKISAALGDR